MAADVPALARFLLSSLAPLALGLTALAAVLLRDYSEAHALAAQLGGVFSKNVHEQMVSAELNRLVPGIAVLLMSTEDDGRCQARAAAHSACGFVLKSHLARCDLALLWSVE